MEKRILTRGSAANQNYFPGLALKDVLSLIAAGIASLKESMPPTRYDTEF